MVLRKTYKQDLRRVIINTKIYFIHTIMVQYSIYDYLVKKHNYNYLLLPISVRSTSSNKNFTMDTFS